MEEDGDNITVAPRPQRKSAPVAKAQRTTSPNSVSRIPETPAIDNANQAPPPAAGANRERHRREVPNITPIDELRIRNAYQREELRSRNREMRELVNENAEVRLERDHFRVERDSHIAERDVARVKEGEMRWWMRVSWFGFVAVVIFVGLYVLWCAVNREEFEYQRRIMRRNLRMD